jgi:hypothetical protein
MACPLVSQNSNSALCLDAAAAAAKGERSPQRPRRNFVAERLGVFLLISFFCDACPAGKTSFEPA